MKNETFLSIVCGIGLILVAVGVGINMFFKISGIEEGFSYVLVATGFLFLGVYLLFLINYVIFDIHNRVQKEVQTE